VTAVGKEQRDLKTSSGPDYAVASNSEHRQERRGETLRPKVGDAVRFSVFTVSGKATIGSCTPAPKHSTAAARTRDHQCGDRRRVPRVLDLEAQPSQRLSQPI